LNLRRVFSQFGSSQLPADSHLTEELHITYSSISQWYGDTVPFQPDFEKKSVPPFSSSDTATLVSLDPAKKSFSAS